MCEPHTDKDSLSDYVWSNSLAVVLAAQGLLVRIPRGVLESLRTTVLCLTLSHDVIS